MSLSLSAINFETLRAQTPDNITLTQKVLGNYRGYSLAPFSWVGGHTGGGIADGYVAAGSKSEISSGAHDSVNIVMLPDRYVSNIISFNIGITGATDVRAVAVTDMGYSSYYDCDIFAVTIQARGGTQKDRIALVILSAWDYTRAPVIQYQLEYELPDRNVYPTSADYDKGSEAFYFSGFATSPEVSGYPHEPLLTDPKSAFLGRSTWVPEGAPLTYGLYDSPIPVDPPPAGVAWGGLYNDYDVFQHIRVHPRILLTGSCNGETYTSWGGSPWPVNTSSSCMFDLDSATLAIYKNSSTYGSNGDCWTLPQILPNRLPDDPSGLEAIDASIDASGSQGFWVVQNRLDTTQWHVTHIGNDLLMGLPNETLSTNSPGWYNTIRDSLYKPAIVYGAQRFEYPTSTAYNSFGIYGKYGTDPFLITLDPGYKTPYLYHGNWAYYSGAFNSYGQLMRYPTLSPDGYMAPDYYDYWMNSNCNHYNLPNSAARFAVGSTPNYIAQMGTYNLGGIATGRFIQGDDYGQAGTGFGICHDAYGDSTVPDLLLSYYNVVESGEFTDPDGGYLPFNQKQTESLYGAGELAVDCIGKNATSPIYYKQLSNKLPKSGITVSPNPTTGYVNINWGSNVDLKNDQIAVSLVDIVGRSIPVTIVSTNTSSSDSRVELGDISPGIYQLNAMVNGVVRKTTKLVIVR